MNNVSFNGSESCGSVSKQNIQVKRYETAPIQEPKCDTVCFKGDRKEKSSKAGVAILGTIVGAAAIIGGLAYAHKADWVSKMSDGKIKNGLSKATETCHEWCVKIKDFGVKSWEKVKNFFKKS